MRAYKATASITNSALGRHVFLLTFIVVDVDFIAVAVVLFPRVGVRVECLLVRI